ncbi:MAG: group II intron reverse transcriptase/maturase [bacterium]|nr:group II intron reverse transcriptase/maturase [bacterium]
MTTAAVPYVGAPPALAKQWEALDWASLHRQVQRLQVRIAKAVKEKRYGKARALQWLLTHSFAAKALAVRRVTSNRGKNSPGVDRVTWRTPRQKMLAIGSLQRRGYRAQPLRRIYIPKSRGGQRPLGIPTMNDRAMQALYLLALNPAAEATADIHSYGFRLGRSTADALGQCFVTLAKQDSPVWVLEGDIESCFDRISHAWLLEHVLIDRSILQTWLKSGYFEGARFFATEQGTPQGGIISPVLANLALDGLEEVVKGAAPYRSKVNTVRFADDFIITGQSRELLEENVLPAVSAFLASRGLRLSASKTQITQIHMGFDFLGANVRKYKGKLLIKPSKRNVVGFVRSIREFVRRARSITTLEFIRALNRKLRGWAHAFRHLVSSRIFSMIDAAIFKSLLRWIRRRHPRKNWRWLRRKYFRSDRGRQWVFTAKARSADGIGTNVDLFRASSLRIRRHIKIRAEATHFDPDFANYFEKRRLQKSPQARNRCVVQPAF